MTTTELFLKENRNEIVEKLNGIVTKKGYSSLKEAMIVFKAKMEASNNNAMIAYCAVHAITPSFGTKIEVVYSKPYSESNHAKQVKYFGSEKTTQLNDI